MKILQFHLLREWIAWFLGTLFFLISTIFLFTLVEDFGQIFPSGHFHFSDFLDWGLQYLPWLLPLSSLLASLFSMAFVKRRGEWTALLANGLSPLQSLSGVLLVGVFVSLFCGWVSDKEWHINHRQAESDIKPLRIKVGKERLWYFRKFSESKMQGSGVQLFCYGEKGEDVFRIRADKASWTADGGWTFSDGRFFGFYAKGQLPVIGKGKNTITWEKPDVKSSVFLESSKSPGFNQKFSKLKIPEVDDDPKPHLLLQEKPKSLSPAALNRLVENFPNQQAIELAPFKLRKAQLWWTAPACMIGLLAGLGVGMSRFSSTNGKSAGIAMLGSIAFYAVRILFDSLGEKMLLSPDLAAAIPYLFALIALAGLWISDQRK